MDKFDIRFDDARIDGTEQWDTCGCLISKEQVEILTRRMVGLKKTMDCLEKARIVKAAFKGVIVLGKVTVWNAECSATFRYEFNPPHEFHAWNIIYNRIVDFGMFGTIERGLQLKDELGPILEGRKPIIVNGDVPDWIQYIPCQLFF